MENNERNDKKEKKEKAFEGEGTKTDKQDGRGKKKRVNSEKKFYLFTAISCAAVLLAIIIVAAVASNSGASQPTGGLPTSTDSVSDESDTSGGGSDEPVVTLPEGMISPVAIATVGNDYGFHYNQTLGSYYVHEGVDFTAEVGVKVFAAEDGVVESIYKDDLLSGTEIVLSHGDGLKTVYCFVTETDGLTVGKSVKKGDVIATVAEPTGNEYKEGAHLHFEIMEQGKSVDPTKYLTLEEK